MTEAELIAQINKKRNELEEKLSADAGRATVATLENEIKGLESELANASSDDEEQQVFLDECAG